MTNSDHKNSSYEQTASNNLSGGCLFLFSSPLYFLMLAIAVFLMAGGETTQPWELTAIPQTSPQKTLAPFFRPEVVYWEENIIRWAEIWDLDPNLVATVMQIESCGDPNALSTAGAIGLFQVMPYHFTEDDKPYKPNINARRGMAYLKQAMQTYNDVRLSFASYNGGISTAAKTEMQWPQQTIDYVYWGTNIYRDAAAGLESSPTLDEWLMSGGASLCSQASLRLGLVP